MASVPVQADVAAPPTLATDRASVRAGAGSASRLRTTPLLIGLAALALFWGALVFRDAIGARLELRAASSAIEAGELERGERALETLVAERPDFEEASAALLRVSGDIVRPLLPAERIARHDHRFGDCTGRLVLHDWGIEFSSRSHGEWTWRFDQVVTMDERGVGRIFLETRESDMMGLLDTKNYNFSILEEPLDPDTWKRYERLFQHAQHAQHAR